MRSANKIRHYSILFILILSLGLNCYFINQSLEKTRVVRVIDGDTFVLKSGERVRLLAVNAPEIDVCLGKEAADLMTKLVLNRRVRLEEITRDDYGRTLAVVFVLPFPVILNMFSPSQTWFQDSNNNVSVNEQIARSGLAFHTSSAGKYGEKIETAIRFAKAKRLAIYSNECQSKTPPNTKCSIKGNIDQSSGTKYYHFLNCLHYNETIINTALGEKWFCSESDAQKSGFVKAKGC